jgi:uncharacterized protein
MKPAVKTMFLMVLILTGINVFGIDARSVKPASSVGDFVGLLDEAGKGNVAAAIDEAQKQTDALIAVVIIRSLDGRNITEFTNEVFNAWDTGPRGKEYGVLILVSMKDKKVKIEAGHGLAPFLKDEEALEIIKVRLSPQFKDRHYADGIIQTIYAVRDIIKGKVPEDKSVLKQRLIIEAISIILTVGIIFIFMNIGGAGRKTRNRNRNKTK